MNKVYNLSSIINEKYLYKSIIRSSKLEDHISDTNNFHFDFKNPNFGKKINIKNFFNKSIFTYFRRQKTDLKFIFLKKINKPKKLKYNEVLRNIKFSKTKSLITKPIRTGFRTISHKYKGFVQKKDLSIILKKFKIQLLNKSQKLTNHLYLTNLHKLKNFLFHKLLFTRKKNMYINFNFLKKKAYNKQKKKRIIRIRLQSKIALKLPKNVKINKEYEKKNSLKKRIKKNYKQKNFKNKSYNKYFKKRTSVKQK